MSPVILLLLSFLIYVAHISIKTQLLRRRMPPGPPPLPLIGNKYDLQEKKPWIKFSEWAKDYGPIFTVWFGQRPTIVVTDPQIAIDLLESRSSNYSSRPRFVVMGEMYTGNNSLLTMPYNDKWKKHRKVLHHGLHPSAARSYRPVQELESKRLARDLLEHPKDYARAVDRYAASVVLALAYGRRADTMMDGGLVDRVRNRMEYMASLNVPGAYLAESIPWLTRIPLILAPWKRTVLQKREEAERLFLSQTDFVKQKMDLKQGPSCFSQYAWSVRDEFGFSDSEFAYVTGALFGAGSDTSSATLHSFFLGLTAFPEVQALAHAELDFVVGCGRSPTWDDEGQLPYISAVVKEVLRWRPVAVLGGTPHASLKDDVYRGMLIPGGSTILSSLWGMHLSEQYWVQPHRFEPLRYMSAEYVAAAKSKPANVNVALNNAPATKLAKGQGSDPANPWVVAPYPEIEGTSAFGWGRRVCPGASVAKNSIFISVARLLWAFEVGPAQRDGKDVPVDIYAYTDGKRRVCCAI